jgi:exodeoxyribonuclease X
MSGATIFDTETTSIDEPEVIELAWTGPLQALPPPDQSIERVRFRPTKPIELGALSTHHILDEELQGEPVWQIGAWTPPLQTEYLIGHNVDFDWKAIGSPPHYKRICTLALSRRLWPEADSHSLAAMIYFHCIERRVAREELKAAHGAAADVEFCCRLLGNILGRLPGVTSWAELYEESERARIPTHMSFGKYGPYEAWAKINGGPMRCADVQRLDRGYWHWLLERCDQVRDDPYLRKALTEIA